MSDDVQARSFEEIQVHLVSLSKRLRALEVEIRRHDEELDTGFRTPLWKRAVFFADGWPLSRVVDAPAPRPWRRWWRS